MGLEEIVYGAKVIATQNQRRKDVWPDQDALHYVANGEIGVIVGEFKGKNATYKGYPRRVEVELSSQPGYAYKYWPSEFGGDDGNPPLELGYAITVHRGQGSEFGRTFLVLPNPGGPVWKGGGSVYVILYQPEVDCLTAVDGLHVASRAGDPYRAFPPEKQSGSRKTVSGVGVNRFSIPGLVQWSRRLAEYLRQQLPELPWS